MTCHYVNSEWQVLLSNKLAEKLNEAIVSWGITCKVIACVHDNAGHMVAANNQIRVSWGSVASFAHIL